MSLSDKIKQKSEEISKQRTPLLNSYQLIKKVCNNKISVREAKNLIDLFQDVSGLERDKLLTKLAKLYAEKTALEQCMLEMTIAPKKFKVPIFKEIDETNRYAALQEAMEEEEQRDVMEAMKVFKQDGLSVVKGTL